MRAPGAADWSRFFAIVAFWGTAFALTKIAVTGMSPGAVVFLRLWIAAALLWGWCLRCGEQLPRLSPAPDPAWLWLLALGIVGNAAPFFLIALGQTQVDSALSAILTSFMPLATVLLAHVFVAGDTLTWRKSAGVLIGFAGIVALVGPSALQNLGGPATLAQFAILLGAICYAVNAILARRAPELPARVIAAGMVVAAAVVMTPYGVWEIARAGPPPMNALAATLALGAGATGVAAILYVQLIRSAGPSFMAQANYLTPVTAVIVGWFLGERLPPSALAAMGLILIGLWLGASRSGSARANTPPPRPRS